MFENPWDRLDIYICSRPKDEHIILLCIYHQVRQDVVKTRASPLAAYSDHRPVVAPNRVPTRRRAQPTLEVPTFFVSDPLIPSAESQHEHDRFRTHLLVKIGTRIRERPCLQKLGLDDSFFSIGATRAIHNEVATRAEDVFRFRVIRRSGGAGQVFTRS